MKEIIYKNQIIKIEKDSLRDANGRYFFRIKIIDDYTSCNGFFYSEEKAIKHAEGQINEIINF